MALDNGLKDLLEAGATDGDVGHHKPSLEGHDGKGSCTSGVGRLCLHELEHVIRFVKEVCIVLVNYILIRSINKPLEEIYMFLGLLSVWMESLVDEMPRILPTLVILQPNVSNEPLSEIKNQMVATGNIHLTG